MPDLPRDYWDACVFLTYVNGSPPERLQHLDALLPLSGKDLQIITSALSITEVAFGKTEQDETALNTETEAKIDGLWTDPGIQLVEFFPLLAYEARALIREAITRGWSLKPMDALHLVTARRFGARRFLTYDDKLPRYSSIIGIPIEEPIAEAPRFPFPEAPAMSDAEYFALYADNAYPALEEVLEG